MYSRNKDGELTDCGSIECADCMFFKLGDDRVSKNCTAKDDVKKWAEEEYKEPITVKSVDEKFIKGVRIHRAMSVSIHQNHYIPVFLNGCSITIT